MRESATWWACYRSGQILPFRKAETVVSQGLCLRVESFATTANTRPKQGEGRRSGAKGVLATATSGKGAGRSLQFGGASDSSLPCETEVGIAAESITCSENGGRADSEFKTVLRSGGWVWHPVRGAGLFDAIPVVVPRRPERPPATFYQPSGLDSAKQFCGECANSSAQSHSSEGSGCSCSRPCRACCPRLRHRSMAFVSHQFRSIWRGRQGLV
jgi:hypothetical protein